MRIFVGTLYTIENEFPECCEAIKRQTYKNFHHFVFKNLPNKEAHITLYRSFMDLSNEFDILIKVDADMVIENRNLFARIVETYQKTSSLRDLEIAVYDFFSDQLIWGLHAYSRHVKWKTSEENLFVDTCHIRPEEKIFDDHTLAPAAFHCKNPSYFQSFHYGVHKALKIIQPNRKKIKQEHRIFHWNIFQKMNDHFLRKQDKRLGLAVLGAEVAFRGGILPKHIDYSNPYLKDIFKNYESLSIHQIKNTIKRLRILRLGFLPKKWHCTLMLKRYWLRHKIQ